MSKFDSIFTGKKGTATQGKAAEPELTESTTAPRKARASAADAALQVAPPSPQAAPVRRGRPNGKRSDPDYVGFTTYIRRDTHHDIKLALLKEKQGRQMSELVEELLREWIERKV